MELAEQIDDLFEIKNIRACNYFIVSLSRYLRMRSLAAPACVMEIMIDTLEKTWRELREGSRWRVGYVDERRQNAMTPDEKAYMDAVTELKESRGEIERVVGKKWLEISDDIEEMETVIDPWSTEEGLLLPQVVRRILLARHIHGITNAQKYAEQVRDVMILRVRSVVAGYNKIHRDGLTGDLFQVDSEGRVRVDLSVIEGLGSAEEGADLD